MSCFSREWGNGYFHQSQQGGSCQGDGSWQVSTAISVRFHLLGQTNYSPPHIKFLLLTDKEKKRRRSVQFNTQQLCLKDDKICRYPSPISLDSRECHMWIVDPNLTFSKISTIEDHDQGHLYTNLEVPRLTCPGRGSNPGLPHGKHLDMQLICWLFGTTTWAEAKHPTSTVPNLII